MSGEPLRAFDAPTTEIVWRVADVLLPATDVMPALRDVDADGYWLARALDARSDAVERVRALLHELAAAPLLREALAGWRSARRDDFEDVAAIVAGTYYLVPAVRELIGYPGQERRPAPLELAADELSDEVFEGAMAYQGTYLDAD